MSQKGDGIDTPLAHTVQRDGRQIPSPLPKKRARSEGSPAKLVEDLLHEQPRSGRQQVRGAGYSATRTRSGFGMHVARGAGYRACHALEKQNGTSRGTGYRASRPDGKVVRGGGYTAFSKGTVNGVRTLSRLHTESCVEASHRRVEP